MKKLKILLMSFIASMSFLAVPTLVHAQSAEDVCAGANFANGGTCDTTQAATDVSSVIKTSIRILQGIVGIISVFVLITAGLNYITSGGDSSKTKTAKDRIIYACVGLVIVVLAQIIVAFVLNRVASVQPATSAPAAATPAAAATGRPPLAQ